MSYSERERIAHVARRLGFGIEPGIVGDATSVDDATRLALDLSTPTPEPTNFVAPTDPDDARSPDQRRAPYTYWITQMIGGPRRIEERLMWFWHDHFATSIRKVKIPYLMFLQHLTVRSHATGSFAEMLYAVAIDPAMLIYLDGAKNQRGEINENFGREVMELFTIGVGNYTEADVLAASAAFSGWTVRRPRRARRTDTDKWDATYVESRHDSTRHTFLGVTGRHTAQDAVDIILAQPETAEFIATKLYHELVGLAPSNGAANRIAATFREDYSIMALVDAIVSEPAFTSDDAIRAKTRTPLERAIGVAQAFDYDIEGERGSAIVRAVEGLGYAPFSPPNVAGYATGRRLLGPHTLVNGFNIAWLLPEDYSGDTSTEAITEALGMFDISDNTRAVLDGAGDLATRAALAINSPEFLTV